VTDANANLNRLTGKTTPVAADRVAYSYDLLGRRLAATYPAGTAAAQEGNVANVYDKVGRLLSTASRGGKLLAYQYDPAGNRTRTTMPDGTALFVQYGYDSLNRVTSIKENGSVNLATYAYDDLSRRTAVTLGNGNVMSYGYNGDDTLASLGHNLQGATTTNDVTLGYGYNQVDQINSRTLSNASYLWKGHYNVNRPYTANGLNQYTASGAKTLSHDPRGNLSGDGTWTFAYDVENRLLNATRSGLAASFAYDTVGRLATTTNVGVTGKYMYDGDDLVAEYNSANALVRRTIHGPGIDEPLAWYEGTALATKRYFQADHQGSIIAVTDQAGAPISQFSYGPYGEPSSLTGSEFRYTGQRLVAGVGLYYYKARFYSPYLGRFLQTDPIGTADDMNRYAYVKNDPLNYTDSTGEFAQLFWGAAIGGGVDAFAQFAENGYSWSRFKQNYSVTRGIVAAGAGALTGGASALISRGATAVATPALRAVGSSIARRAASNGAVGAAAGASQTAIVNQIPGQKKNSVIQGALLGGAFGAAGSVVADGIPAVNAAIKESSRNGYSVTSNFIDYATDNSIVKYSKASAASVSAGNAAGNATSSLGAFSDAFTSKAK
jgi:RHS repeat-associated protein